MDSFILIIALFFISNIYLFMNLFYFVTILLFYSLNLYGSSSKYLPIYHGVEYKEVVRYLPNKVNDDRLRVHITKIDVGSEGIDFVVTEAVEGKRETRAMKTSSFLREKGLQVAINGGGYWPVVSGEEGVHKQILSYAISRGRKYGDFNNERDAALVVTNDGRIMILNRAEVNNLKQEEIKVGLGGWRHEGSSALIVDEGKGTQDDASSNLFGRTAVGISKDGKTLYLVVVDGPWSKGFWYSDQISIGMSMKGLAEFMVEIGCWRAMNLAGLESSSMVFEGIGGPMIVNLPSDCDMKSERAVGINLGIFAKQLGEESKITLRDIERNSEALRLKRDRLYHEGMADFSAYLDRTRALNLGLKDEMDMMSLDRGRLSLEGMKLVSKKSSGVSHGGVYRDRDGVVWFVKQGQNAEYEFLASVMMNVLFGNRTPLVKLVDGRSGYTASRNILGFMQKKGAPEKTVRYGEGALAVALDWLGVFDRHEANMGYIVREDGLEATRVDYDASFDFRAIYETEDTDQDRPNFNGHLIGLIDAYGIEEVVGMLEVIRDLPEDVLIKLFDVSVAMLEENNFRVNAKSMDKILNHLIERKYKIGKLLEVVGRDGRYRFISDLLHNKSFKSEGMVFPKAVADFIFKKYFIFNGCCWNNDKDEHVEAARLLLEQGADVKNMNNCDLAKVAVGGNTKMMRLLITHGANVKSLDDYLAKISVAGNVEMIKLLMEKGVEVGNIKDFTEMTSEVVELIKGAQEGRGVKEGV